MTPEFTKNQCFFPWLSTRVESRRDSRFRRCSTLVAVRHPVLPKEYTLAWCVRQPGPLTRQVASFQDQVARIQAGEQDRFQAPEDYHPWAAIVLCPFSADYDTFHTFPDRASVDAWAAELKELTLERRDEILAIQESGGPDQRVQAAASYRQFAGAARQCGIPYAHATGELYRAYFDLAATDPLPTRRQLDPQDLKVLVQAESVFVQRAEPITSPEAGLRLIRQVGRAGRLIRAQN